MNTVYKVHFTLYYVSLMCIHVGDVRDVKYLNISAIPSNTVCIKACWQCQRCQRSSTYIGFDGMAAKP